MVITKNDLITEAYSKLRINGLTVSPTPEDFLLGLRRLFGVVASLPFDVGYLYPATIGEDDPSDDSGVDAYAFDPLSTVLAYRLSQDFGKPYSPSEYADAMATLSRRYVDVSGGKYPVTLPVGSGNSYEYDNQGFYLGNLPTQNSGESN